MAEGAVKGSGGFPCLVVKIYYPSICSVEEGDLDQILHDLVQEIHGFTVTVQASCKASSTKTLMRSIADYVTGGPVSLNPYCKTGSAKTPSVLIEMLTTEENIKHALPYTNTVQKKVDLYVKTKTNTTNVKTLPPVVVQFSI